MSMPRLTNEELLYHVTVLSNFARGFDKYSRAYSKAAIAESTYPERFFLLRRDELGVGVAKAKGLLAKLALPGDRLVVLQTHVDPGALRLNLNTGLGRWIPSPRIRVDRLHDIAPEGADWRLEPLLPEDAMAQALRLVGSEFTPFEQLRPRTLSVLPIAKGCQASCPFCFSTASASVEQRHAKADLPRVAEFAGEARARGAERFVVTGGGEPGLVRHAELTRLIAVGTGLLERSVLITNGHHLARQDAADRRRVLADYHAAGLGVLAVSRHHHDDETNAALMGLHTPVAAIAETWRCGRDRWASLRMRLICVLQRGGIEDAGGVAAYVDWATRLGVEEICFKELYVSTSIESVYHDHAANGWSRAHQVSLSLVVDYAASHGLTEVSRLPWGAPVFGRSVRERPVQIAAYTEPSLYWERTHGIARSWNLMSDGRCLASLEDRASEIVLPPAA